MPQHSPGSLPLVAEDAGDVGYAYERDQDADVLFLEDNVPEILQDRGSEKQELEQMAEQVNLQEEGLQSPDHVIVTLMPSACSLGLRCSVLIQHVVQPGSACKSIVRHFLRARLWIRSPTPPTRPLCDVRASADVPCADLCRDLGPAVPAPQQQHTWLDSAPTIQLELRSEPARAAARADHALALAAELLALALQLRHLEVAHRLASASQ